MNKTNIVAVLPKLAWKTDVSYIDKPRKIQLSVMVRAGQDPGQRDPSSPGGISFLGTPVPRSRAQVKERVCSNTG